MSEHDVQPDSGEASEEDVFRPLVGSAGPRAWPAWADEGLDATLERRGVLLQHDGMNAREERAVLVRPAKGSFSRRVSMKRRSVG